MIDLHCHLDLYPKPREHLRDLSPDVQFILSVTNTPSAFRGTATLEREHPSVHTAIGLHPQVARERRGEIPLLVDLIASTTFVGEIGLDGQTVDPFDRECQMAAFKAALDASVKAGGRVLSVHSRRAAAPVIDEIAARPRLGAPVLHWFSGTKNQLETAVAAGCWFSVSPTMLASSKGRAIAERMPRDRILTETDGPFAALGDRPASPIDVRVATAALGEIWRVPAQEAADRVAANLSRLLS